MPAAGQDSFDVFELDHSHPAGSGADEIQIGSPRGYRPPGVLRTRWTAAGAVSRRLVLGSVVALLVAVMALVGAVRAHPVVHRTTRVSVVAAPAVSVDALGCPDGRRCVTDVAPAAVLAAARAALPQGHVTYALRETDADTGRVYRLVVAIAATETTIQVESQCVPAAAPVADAPLTVSTIDGSVITPVAADQPTPAGLKLWTITLAGPANPTCGVTVTAESRLVDGIGGRAIDTVINLLADDPRLMATG